MSPTTAPSTVDLHADKTPNVIVVTALLGSVAVIAVALRFFARHVSGTKVWWDDWLVLGAAVSPH